jgi:hypothetical protein
VARATGFLLLLFVSLVAKGTKHTNNNKQLQTTTTPMVKDVGLLLPAANGLLPPATNSLLLLVLPVANGLLLHE